MSSMKSHSHKSHLPTTSYILLTCLYKHSLKFIYNWCFVFQMRLCLLQLANGSSSVASPSQLLLQLLIFAVQYYSQHNLFQYLQHRINNGNRGATLVKCMKYCFDKRLSQAPPIYLVVCTLHYLAGLVFLMRYFLSFVQSRFLYWF